jgi:hypothetical protein
MAHMAFKRVDFTLVVVQDAVPPTDEEWQRYLDACVQLGKDLAGDYGKASALIFTDGGAPNGKQRVAIAKLLGGRAALSAVVCDSLMIRAALGALGLINPGIKVFPSRDWVKAAAFARVPVSKHMEVLKIAVGLSHEVGDVKVLRAIGL